MAGLIRLFHVLVLSTLLLEICGAGHVYIQFKVLQYDNPDGTSYNGQTITGARKCCDTTGSSNCLGARNKCDTFFVFCTGSSNRCSGQQLKSKVLVNTCSYSTTPYNASIVITTKVDDWKSSGMRILSDIYDDDGSNRKDLIDKFTTPISGITPDSGLLKAKPHVMHFKHLTSLDVEMKIWCQDHYSGSNCDVKCNPLDACDGTHAPLPSCGDPGDISKTTKHCYTSAFNTATEHRTLLTGQSLFYLDHQCQCRLCPYTSYREEENEKPKDKLHQIAYELLTTERAYVARLHLLDQVFHFYVMTENKNSNFIPEEAVSQMFANIKPIFLFHKDFLLPQLEARMKTWSTEQKIGDIMAKLAPFLKLYTEYVKNYNNAMGLIDKWTNQSPKFAALLEAIQKKPECGQLTLQHHMLEPIQRVPRYEMLLKDYLKHLASDSPDRSDGQKALELVTSAAMHSNKAMKKIENFIKVLNILKHLSGEGLEDLVCPTRELLKEGPITKIAARSGEKQPRYLFLFNDILLVCVKQGVLGPYKYRVRARLGVNGMEIAPGGSMSIQNTFCVKCVEKSVEFLDESNNGNGSDWFAAFEQVITDFQNKVSISHMNSIPNDEESCEDLQLQGDIGKKAPHWVKNTEVTMCRMCQEKFKISRRQHHCRACGYIYCGKCSSKKAPLEYDNNQMNRVCDKCYAHLMGHDEEAVSPTSPKPNNILQVEADRAAVLSGYLNMMDKGRTWCKRWITAHQDFVMYFYKKHKDVKALQSLPLAGHTVRVLGEAADRPNVFALMHKDINVCFFQADTEDQFNEWVQKLGKMVLLELPIQDESKRLSSHSTGSSHSNSSGQSSQS